MEVVEDGNFTHYVSRLEENIWAFVIRPSGATDVHRVPLF